MVKRFAKEWISVDRLLHSIPVVLFVIGFGLIGYHLLHPSQAASSLPVSYSLVPAAIDLAPGESINIAVNADVSDITSGLPELSSVVDYPTDILHLDAVRDVCQTKGLEPDNNSYDISKPGTASLHCAASDSQAIAAGNHTLAVLVFTATKTTADQTISVNPASSAGESIPVSPQSASNPTDRHANRVEARVRHPNAAGGSKLRPLPNYHGRPLCRTAAQQPSCLAVQAVDAANQPVSGNAAVVSGYGPQQFHTAYQLPCKPGGPVAAVCAAPASYGPGTIALVELGGYTGGTDVLESDLASYSQQFGIPSCTRANGCLKVVNYQGKDSPLPTNDWTDEIALDLDAAHQICQTCKILVIEASPGTGEDGNAYAVSQRPLAIANMWYVPGVGTADDAAAAKMAGNGVPILTAAGDVGISNAGENSYPAHLNTVIAVAGTTLRLNADNTWAGETVWQASGGGCSTQFSAPSWQASLPNWSGAGCGNKRAFGDISLDGDVNTGAAVFIQGKWFIVGGTSLGTPLLLGMYGLAGSGGSLPSGNAASIMYQKMNTSNSHDITSGNNCISGVTANCTAGPGFDTPSGLGSPIGLTGIGGPPAAAKTGDLNKDGLVNLTDLSVLLSRYGGTDVTADINGNGKVDLSDLSVLLTNFGK